MKKTHAHKWKWWNWRIEISRQILQAQEGHAFFGGQDSLQYKINPAGPLTRYVKLGVAHAPGMLGTFCRHRLQRKPLVSDPDVHHGTCVMHVPWCTSGSLSRGGRENVPGIPGTCATRNFTYLARGSCWKLRNQLLLALNFYSSTGKTDSLKLPSAVLGKGGNGYRWSSRNFLWELVKNSCMISP